MRKAGKEMAEEFAKQGIVVSPDLVIQEIPYVEPDEKPLTADKGVMGKVITYGVLPGTDKPSLFGTVTIRSNPKYEG